MPLLCHKFGFESLHDWRKFAGSFIKMLAQRKLPIPNAMVNALGTAGRLINSDGIWK